MVVHHLAQCAECREIVFLASEAAEDEVLDERELVAVAATAHPVPKPAYVAASTPVASRTEKSRPRWTTRMRWAVSIAAAALLVAAGFVLRFSRANNEHGTAPAIVASNRPVPAMPETPPQAVTPPNSQQAAAKPSASPTLAESLPHKATTTPAGKTSSSTIVARNADREFSSAPKANTAAGASSTPAVIGGAVPFAIPAVPTQNSFAETEGAQALQQTAPLTFGKTQMGMLSVHAVRPQWRIGPQGHLERSITADQWTRVLNDRPVTFRAVAVMGNDVWAGGNGGALFHSPDRGEHWNKVSLAANSNVETGAIVSIHFDDAQHGVITADDGTNWVTIDGGLTWTTQ